MMDFSEDSEFNQKRVAIHADLLHIKECLSVNKGFEEAQRSIEIGKKHLNTGYSQFMYYFINSMDHVIVIHLWNLVGMGKTNKHNLCTYVDCVRKNIDEYIKFFLHEQVMEGFVDPTQEIIMGTARLNKYLNSLNTGNNSFYERLKRWRNQVYAHSDDDVGVGRFMSPKSKLRSDNWENKNRIEYSEIEQVFNCIWDLFYAIDRTMITQDFNLKPISCDILKYLFRAS